MDLRHARHPQLYLLSAPLVTPLDFLWEIGTFGRERTLSIYAFPRLRRHLCFGDGEGVTGLLGEGNGALLHLGSENLGGILFDQSFPRLFHPVYDPSPSSLRTGPGSCRHKADAHPRGIPQRRRSRSLWHTARYPGAHTPREKGPRCARSMCVVVGGQGYSSPCREPRQVTMKGGSEGLEVGQVVHPDGPQEEVR